MQKKTGRRPSILDVARESGLSKSAVSRALRGQGRVSEQSREKVRRAADELGYIFDARAQGLATDSSKVLGLLVRASQYSYYGELVIAVQSAAEAEGYGVVVVNGLGGTAGQAKALRQLISSRVDGIIVASGQLPIAELERFAQELPIVVAGRRTSSSWIGSVDGADRRGAEQLADRVVQQGHRRVGVVTVPRKVSATRYARADAMLRRLAKHGISTVAIPLSQDQNSPEPAALREAAKNVTAIMSPNDPALISAWEILQTIGLRVPEDVSLTGYDGIGQLSSPVLGLTTWQQPLEKIGGSATGLLLEQLRNESPRHVQLPGVFLEGRTLSTAPQSTVY